MDREQFQKMLNSLKVFSEKKSLLSMTREELLDLPKEVIITCASDEIAYVHQKLSPALQNDPDINKYLYCTKHHNNQQEGDVIDSPSPRRIFCRYCNIEEVNLGTDNKVKMIKSKKRPRTSGCLL